MSPITAGSLMQIGLMRLTRLDEETDRIEQLGWQQSWAIPMETRLQHQALPVTPASPGSLFHRGKKQAARHSLGLAQIISMSVLFCFPVHRGHLGTC